MSSSETAAELVAQADAVLLDFDGPLCSVFAGYRAHDVAAEITKHAAAAGYALRPDDPDDPISVYKATTGMDPDVIAVVEGALVEEESTPWGTWWRPFGRDAEATDTEASGRWARVLDQGMMNDFVQADPLHRPRQLGLWPIVVGRP